MKNIALGNIAAPPKSTSDAESFSICNIEDLLAGKNIIQEQHKQDYFYILALKKGKGCHMRLTSYR